MCFGKSATELGKLLKAKGIAATAEPLQMTPEELGKVCGSQRFAQYAGSNCRCISNRIRQLGWQPKHDTYYASLAGDLDFILAMK
jgi:hypothetical protein